MPMRSLFFFEASGNGKRRSKRKETSSFRLTVDRQVGHRLFEQIGQGFGVLQKFLKRIRHLIVFLLHFLIDFATILQRNREV